MARILSQAEMAGYIDHTLLKPDAVSSQFDTLCNEALHYNFKSVCVNSSRIAYVAEKLKDSSVAICSVIGFPLGAMSTRCKAFEAAEACRLGASEIDMVINIGVLKSGDFDFIRNDIRAVREAIPAVAILKVIIETCLLTQDEKIKACELAVAAGADFVKTSTGFSSGGATVEDVALMKRVVGDKAKVKASGGIRNWDQALAMIEAGAERIGAGAGVAILNGKTSSEIY